jgi:ADP-ribose pyrophosphatase
MQYFDLINTHKHLFRNMDDDYLKIELEKEKIKAWTDIRKKELSKNGEPENWGKIDLVYEDPFIIILRDLVVDPSGSQYSYIRILNRAALDHGPAVVVMPEYKGKLVLQKQYRHPIRKWSWEFPRGFGENNVPAMKNAEKEIMEEIGGQIEEIRELGKYCSNTGLEANEVIMFFAKLRSIGRPNTDEAITQIKLMTSLEVEGMIKDNTIVDGFTIGAYTKAKLMGLIL